MKLSAHLKEAEALMTTPRLSSSRRDESLNTIRESKEARALLPTMPSYDSQSSTRLMGRDVTVE